MDDWQKYAIDRGGVENKFHKSAVEGVSIAPLGNETNRKITLNGVYP
jgi:hypothetical protein